MIRRHPFGLLAAGVLLAAPASAHDGPPYPIFVDEPIGAWSVSIWTDPDVGVGTFYYYIEPPAGRSAEELRVTVSAEPLDGHAARVFGSSEDTSSSAPYQQTAELAFDARGTWATRFRFEGAKTQAELELDLEVTPPGLGPIDVLWFLLPFLAVGFFWLRALLAQRAYDRSRPTQR